MTHTKISQSEARKNQPRRSADVKKALQALTIQVAFNPITRKYERVHDESEVKGSKVITMVWSGSLNKYVVIPE